MNRNWENLFAVWANGPSATEQLKAERAERQVKQAILEDSALKNRHIRVFTQGSYRNRVNVRQESDVDIGVLCFDAFFAHYPDDNVKQALREAHLPADYEYQAFKRDLERALVNYFGRAAVTRGEKAFDIKANTYRVDADVAGFFEHRRYISTTKYLSGVEMIPDDLVPPRIRNWPEQHYDSGVRKNDLTARRYKKFVRILKSLCNEMCSSGMGEAEIVPSFLLECLVFNVDDDLLIGSGYYDSLGSILIKLYSDLQNISICSEWGEVSKLKYLFRGSQPWTREDAAEFIASAYGYVGYQ